MVKVSFVRSLGRREMLKQSCGVSGMDKHAGLKDFLGAFKFRGGLAGLKDLSDAFKFKQFREGLSGLRLAADGKKLTRLGLSPLQGQIRDASGKMMRGGLAKSLAAYGGSAAVGLGVHNALGSGDTARG